MKNWLNVDGEIYFDGDQGILRWVNEQKTP